MHIVHLGVLRENFWRLIQSSVKSMEEFQGLDKTTFKKAIFRMFLGRMFIIGINSGQNVSVVRTLNIFIIVFL